MAAHYILQTSMERVRSHERYRGQSSYSPRKVLWAVIPETQETSEYDKSDTEWRPIPFYRQVWSAHGLMNDIEDTCSRPFCPFGHSEGC